MPTLAWDEFLLDLGLIKEAEQAGVALAYIRKQDTHWEIWLNFCNKVQIDPHLNGIVDPVPYLQVFGAQYRNGRITPSYCGIESVTVSDTIYLVGQRFARMGAVNPCLNLFWKVDFCLGQQLRSYTKSDPPNNRVKPLLVCIVVSVLELAAGSEHGSLMLLLLLIWCVLLSSFVCIRLSTQVLQRIIRFFLWTMSAFLLAVVVYHLRILPMPIYWHQHECTLPLTSRKT